MMKNGLYSFAVSALLLFGTACSSDDNTSEEEIQEPVALLTHEEVIGVWEAQGYRWDIEEGKSSCYLMTADGDDFQYDENGEYITISIREYCEQYAEDYNRDPNNEVKGTPEDFANHDFSDTYMFSNIEVTEDEVVIYVGQDIPDQGTLNILAVKGEYTFDEENAILIVNNVAIESSPEELEIKVFKDDEDRINFRYTDFDIYTAYSYDKSESYWVYAPMIYYCVEGEPIDTEGMSIQGKESIVPDSVLKTLK